MVVLFDIQQLKLNITIGRDNINDNVSEESSLRSMDHKRKKLNNNQAQPTRQGNKSLFSRATSAVSGALGFGNTSK